VKGRASCGIGIVNVLTEEWKPRAISVASTFKVAQLYQNVLDVATVFKLLGKGEAES
jgi:hypothetical protein